MFLSIGLVVVTIILSAFFSGSEIAYLSANKLSIEVLKNKGSNKGKILTELYEDPKTFLSTMLVGNNIVLVMYTMVFSALIQPLMLSFMDEGSVVISLATTLVLTLVLLVFGEFMPKTFFRLYANELMFRLAYILKFFKWLLVIPSWLLTKTSNFVIKLIFGNIEAADDTVITKLDLEHYINSNVKEEKDIDREILNNALNLHQLKVRECMVPRKEIVYIDKSDDIATIKEAFISSKHSRLIVVDGDVENVIGYLHHQQLFKNPASIKRHFMDIEFVPEVLNVQELMYTFIKSNTNIACVVDEFGGLAGIITLEDILEEIFGEIEDEHDDEQFTDTQVSDNEYVFSGRLEMSYLNGKYQNLNLPDEEYNTLSGYIVMTHGSIPEEGEEIWLDNFRFLVMSKSDTRIEEVRVFKTIKHHDKIDSE